MKGERGQGGNIIGVRVKVELVRASETRLVKRGWVVVKHLLKYGS